MRRFLPSGFARRHPSTWERGHPFATLRAGSGRFVPGVLPGLLTSGGFVPGVLPRLLTSGGFVPGVLPRLLTFCAVLTISLSVFARIAHADQLDDETRRIGKQLQCPVCAGASVADSPSDLAGQMRSVIRAKVEAGEPDDQIVGYFVERYGDGILIEPPRRGLGLAVWLAPVLMLTVGGVLLWRLLRTWLRPRPVPPSITSTAPPSVPYRNGTAHAEAPAPISTVDRARAELDRYRQEG